MLTGYPSIFVLASLSSSSSTTRALTHNVQKELACECLPSSRTCLFIISRTQRQRYLPIYPPSSATHCSLTPHLERYPSLNGFKNCNVRPRNSTQGLLLRMEINLRWKIIQPSSFSHSSRSYKTKQPDSLTPGLRDLRQAPPSDIVRHLPIWNPLQ